MCRQGVLVQVVWGGRRLVSVGGGFGGVHGCRSFASGARLVPKYTGRTTGTTCRTTGTTPRQTYLNSPRPPGRFRAHNGRLEDLEGCV